jgi:hypothetical protein
MTRETIYEVAAIAPTFERRRAEVEELSAPGHLTPPELPGPPVVSTASPERTTARRRSPPCCC